MSNLKSLLFLIFPILSVVAFSFVNVSALGTITKEYFDLSGAPLTQITQGGTYKVSFSYKNIGSIVEETSIKNYIGPNQHYVPNSLVLPKYWELGADTDLTTTSPNPHFEIDGDAGPQNGIGKLTPNTAVAPTKIPAAIKKTATGGVGGGDGYIPIFWDSPDGSFKRVCEVYHHDFGVPPNETGARINCQDNASGTLIAGYPKKLSNDPATNGMTWNYVDGRDADVAQIGSKIYVGAMKSNFVLGFLCFDLLSDSPCTPSFTPLSAPGMDIGVAYSSGLTGIYKYQDYFYVAGFSVPDGTGANNKPRIFCWNIVTGSYCTGFTIDGVVDNYSGQEFITMSNYLDKLIIADSIGTPGSLNCFNIGAGGAISQCLGFPLNTNGNVSPQYYLDNVGNVIGFCVMHFSVATPPLCYKFDGTPLVALPFMSPPDMGYSGTSLKVGTKVYYPTSLSQSFCWDFALSDTPQGGYCPTFKDNGDATHPPVPGLRRWYYPTFGSTTEGMIPDATDYGYTLFKGCIYGLGDAGTLWTFDSDTGESPCIVHVGSTNVSSIQSSACSASGIVNNVEKFGWVYPKGNVYPPGLTTLSMTTYSDEAMTKPIPGYTDVNIPASGIDLSSIDIVTYPSIWMKYTAIGSYEEDFKIFATFQMEKPVTYTSCFEVKVDDVCDIGNIVNPDAVVREVTSGITTNIPTDTIPVINNASCVGGIGDLVWNDVNHNGIQDPGEPPLSGIKLDLLDNNSTIINSSTTDLLGNYLFSSIPSNKKYKIHINTELTSSQISPKNVGSDRTKDSDINPSTMLSDDILVYSGVLDKDSGDAGLENNTIIQGTITNDVNFNNVRDKSEIGMAGIIVSIVNNGGAVILSTTSDADGKYHFWDITSLDMTQKYHLTISNLSNWVLDLKSIGVDNSIDSDFDLNYNSDEFSPPPNAIVLTFDAGLHQKNTDIEIKVSHASDTECHLGDQVNFIYTLKNNGPFAVEQLELSDAIGDGLLKFSSYIASRGNYDPITKIWKELNFLPGESITLTFSALDSQNVDGLVFVTASIKNTKGSDNLDIVDTNSLNDISSDNVKISKFHTDLKVEKTHTGIGPFKRGDRVDFQIKVTNQGDIQVDNMTLVDTFPIELKSLDNWNADKGVYDFTTKSWTGLSLKNGDSAILYVSANVIVDETKNFVNVVDISDFTKHVVILSASAISSDPSSSTTTTNTINTNTVTNSTNSLLDISSAIPVKVLGTSDQLVQVGDDVASNNHAVDNIASHKVLAATGSNFNFNFLVALTMFGLIICILQLENAFDLQVEKKL